MNGMTCLTVEDYRSLARVSIELRSLNVLFGPNGSGKSTLLDTIWFFRDCAIRGVELVSSERSHGIGILWDGAEDDAQISLSLADDRVEYGLSFGLSAGRMEPFPGERLFSKTRDTMLIDKSVGSDRASFWNVAMGQQATFTLREPERLSLSRYLDVRSQNGSVRWKRSQTFWKNMEPDHCTWQRWSPGNRSHCTSRRRIEDVRRR